MPAAPTTCPKCSTPIPEGGRFCMSCGFDVSDPSGGTTLAISDRRADELQRMVDEATRGVYRIERELGRGGMAAVYLATELELNRKVAIKILPPEFTFGEGLVERFQREARTAAQLDHPNIIPIYRVGSAGRLLYFAMKYVEGRSVADVLRERTALPMSTVTAVLEPVASALAYAHSRGVIHRDIKPANVLIDRQGVVLVSDFGIARAASDETITQSGAVVGTPQYMSPEQCAGRRLTAASDQYSLAVVGFEMLAGRPPFDAESAITLLQKHIGEPPPRLAALRPDAPAELIAVIERAMQKQPEQRFADMTQFTDAVELIRSGQDMAQGRAQLRALAVGQTLSGLRVVTPVSGPALTKRQRRRTSLLAALGAVVVAGGAGIGVWQWLGSRPSGTPAPETGRVRADTGTVLTRAGDSATRTRTQDTARTPGKQAEARPAAPAAPPPAKIGATPGERADQPRAAIPAPIQQFIVGTLVLTGLPAGATVTVDGRIATGGRADLEPGSHRVEIAAPGYQPYSQSVVVTAGRTNSFAPTLTPAAAEPGRASVQPPVAGAPIQQPTVGTLMLSGLPAGAAVTVDGNPITGGRANLAAGRHVVEIAAEGFQPYSQTVAITAGRSSTLAPTLTPVPLEPGRLSVGSIPPGVLWIDDERIGEVPIRERSIQAGRRRLRIVAPGYQPYDTTVVVAPGQAINLGFKRLSPGGSEP